MTPQGKMPEWISRTVNGTQRERDLHEALRIAWEVLDDIKRFKFDSTKDRDYSQTQARVLGEKQDFADQAMSHIRALGGKR